MTMTPIADDEPVPCSVCGGEMLALEYDDMVWIECLKCRRVMAISTAMLDQLAEMEGGE